MLRMAGRKPRTLHVNSTHEFKRLCIDFFPCDGYVSGSEHEDVRRAVVQHRASCVAETVLSITRASKNDINRRILQTMGSGIPVPRSQNVVSLLQ